MEHFVAFLTDEEIDFQLTREHLNRLKQIPIFNLSVKELATLRFEIESCELYLFELTDTMFDGRNVYPFCGIEVDVNAKFCGQCGKPIQF